MSTIYIFGHKKPDTDSTCSAIALSYLKNKLGMNTTPVVLGDINNETKFVLNYFNIVEPKYLNDVKLQIKDINYRRNVRIYAKSSILDTFNYMLDNKISALPIVDINNKFLGLVSMKDIAKEQIGGNIYKLNTSYENIIKTLNGNSILKFNNDIKGDIKVVSMRSSSFIENYEMGSNDILIIGDRHSIIEHAVLNKVKLIIITSDREIKDEHIEIAKENMVNIIKTPYDTFKTATTIVLSNYIANITVTKDVTAFDENVYVNDFLDIANRVRHSNYPIINKKNECLGILSMTDSQDKQPKKVILVDHNEREQSVEGLEEAEIIEIVDHHKIGNLDTHIPINFRNMTVGSTNTIIYLLYKEYNVEIPANIAGLMLSGIISDTVMLTSPTTTNTDKMALLDLEKIANINYKEYGLKMFEEASSLKGKTKEEILYTDFKNFTVDNKKIGIGQFLTMNPSAILNEKDEYASIIENIAQNNNYYIVALFVTDIINKGSHIIFNSQSKNIFENCFDLLELKQGEYLQDIVSRKKQVIPNLIATIEKTK